MPTYKKLKRKKKNTHLKSTRQKIVTKQQNGDAASSSQCCTCNVCIGKRKGCCCKIETKYDKNSSKNCIIVPSKAPMKKRIVNNHDLTGGVKRIFSPFNKFSVNRPTETAKKMPKSPFVIPRNGLSSKERSFVVCSCQTKTTRYIGLKAKAQEAIKHKKIFTIYGKSNAVRTALIRRGWVEKIPPNRMNLTKIRENKVSTRTEVNEELERLLLSNLVERHPANLIWGTAENVNDLSKRYNVQGKEPTVAYPLMNKLRIEALWTTKQGLCNASKESYWYYIEDVAEFDTPRTYSNVDGDERADFTGDYKLTSCTSLLKWIVSMVSNKRPIFSETGKISMNVMVFALNRCKEYLYKKQNRDIDKTIYSSATSGQWNSFLKKYYILMNNEDVFQSDKDRKLPLYIGYAKLLLREIHKYRPQLSCEGCHNIWIIKPAHCSRGRGIKMASKLSDINDIITKTSLKFVVQKYIEDPLLIHETKFDIRQYYLITSTCPLVIWMYKDCYLKFSSQKYNLKNYHESIHLTNNAVQKKYKNCLDRHNELPQHNMWDLDTYKEYLNKIGKELVWDNLIYPGMKKTIVGIMLSYQDSLSQSKNCFELYGCDFILDKEYRPWLIEINQGPDLNPTTEVTAKICPAVIEDVIKVVIDNGNDPKASTGKFECVYRTPPYTAPRYGANDLVVIGIALPHDYFYRGKIEVEESCYTSNINDKQRDINKMLKKLKTMYETDIMKEPDNDDYLNYLDNSTGIHKTQSDYLLENETITEQADESLFDKITSNHSVGSKRNECKSSISTSSINLRKKGYVSRSVSNLKTDSKKSLNKFKSSVEFKAPFEFSKLEDGSEGKDSFCSLQKGTELAGTSKSVDSDKCATFDQDTTNINSSLHEIFVTENAEVTCNRNNVSKYKPTVREITQRIFEFLENKENEYIVNK